MTCAEDNQNTILPGYDFVDMPRYVDDVVNMDVCTGDQVCRPKYTQGRWYHIYTADAYDCQVECQNTLDCNMWVFHVFNGQAGNDNSATLDQCWRGYTNHTEDGVQLTSVRLNGDPFGPGTTAGLVCSNKTHPSHSVDSYGYFDQSWIDTVVFNLIFDSNNMIAAQLNNVSTYGLYSVRYNGLYAPTQLDYAFWAEAPSPIGTSDGTDWVGDGGWSTHNTPRIGGHALLNMWVGASTTDGVVGVSDYDDDDSNYVNHPARRRYEASIAQCAQKLNSSHTTNDGMPLTMGEHANSDGLLLDGAQGSVGGLAPTLASNHSRLYMFEQPDTLYFLCVLHEETPGVVITTAYPDIMILSSNSAQTVPAMTLLSGLHITQMLPPNVTH